MTGEAIAIAWTPRVSGRARLLSDAEIRRAAAAACAHGRRPGLALSIVFVADAELARMHGRYLDDPRPTDVITFDLGADGNGAAAELYVSVERARAVARERGLAPDRELALYVVHGCLHVCGFDDRRPSDRTRMRAAERAVLSQLGYAES